MILSRTYLTENSFFSQQALIINTRRMVELWTRFEILSVQNITSSPNDKIIIAKKIPG